MFRVIVPHQGRLLVRTACRPSGRTHDRLAARRNLVSVIMPAHNGAYMISSALASLASEAEVIGKIIVDDDNSTDGTGASRRRLKNLPDGE
jgi:hypothetical protein